jgi:hypothetical protein
VLLAVPAEREADDVADQRVAQRRAVAAGRGGNLDRRSPGCFELRDLPRLEPASGAAEALGAGGRGDDDARRGEQRAAGGVEVVAVVVVGEEDRVDRQEVGRRDRRSGELARRRAPPEVVLPARRIERRIGQQAPAVDFDQRGRSADVRDPEDFGWSVPASNRLSAAAV